MPILIGPFDFQTSLIRLLSLRWCLLRICYFSSLQNLSKLFGFNFKLSFFTLSSKHLLWLSLSPPVYSPNFHFLTSLSFLSDFELEFFSQISFLSQTLSFPFLFRPKRISFFNCDMHEKIKERERGLKTKVVVDVSVQLETCSWKVRDSRRTTATMDW